jgi:hypothetical protein
MRKYLRISSNIRKPILAEIAEYQQKGVRVVTSLFLSEITEGQRKVVREWLDDLSRDYWIEHKFVRDLQD